MLSKLLTASGVPFYVFGARVDDTAFFWVCFLGCPDEIKNYAVTLSLSGQTIEKLSYHGNVHTLDDDFEHIIKGALIPDGIFNLVPSSKTQKFLFSTFQPKIKKLKIVISLNFLEDWIIRIAIKMCC